MASETKGDLVATFKVYRRWEEDYDGNYISKFKVEIKHELERYESFDVLFRIAFHEIPTHLVNKSRIKLRDSLDEVVPRGIYTGSLLMNLGMAMMHIGKEQGSHMSSYWAKAHQEGRDKGYNEGLRIGRKQGHEEARDLQLRSDAIEKMRIDIFGEVEDDKDPEETKPDSPEPMSPEEAAKYDSLDD